ncbi:MAG: OpgC domain-containing protein [Planctomycetota bacterium]
MTTDAPFNPLVPTTGQSASRDLRVDFVREVALLIIFSDHVIGNPVRDFMPISLGFSDMGEVFIFLSGYENGIRRLPADFPCGTRRQLAQTLARCLRLYGAILLMQALTVVLLAVAGTFGIR